MPTHTIPDSNISFTSPPKHSRQYEYGKTSPRIKELFELAVYLGEKFSQTARYPEGSKNGISVEKLIKDLSAIPESRRKAREAREARESRKQKLEELVATLVSSLDQANFCPDAHVQDVKAHGADGDILYEMTLKNLSSEQAEAVVAVLRETGVQYETRGY